MPPATAPTPAPMAAALLLSPINAPRPAPTAAPAPAPTAVRPPCVPVAVQPAARTTTLRHAPIRPIRLDSSIVILLVFRSCDRIAQTRRTLRSPPGSALCCQSALPARHHVLLTEGILSSAGPDRCNILAQFAVVDE